MKITDYNLDNLFINDESSYTEYIYGFLISAISNFFKCNQDLSDRSSTAFTADLSDLEKEILATLMVVEWCTKETNSIMEMRRHLNDTDFKLYSEAQHLKEKRNLLTDSIELVDKKITSYGYHTLDTSLFE
jgi:DNA-binding transcriptional regulator GbsR (MarR family)